MTDIDQNGLEAAVRECARITAPEVTDEEFERERVEGSSRYLKTREEMSRAIRAYLSAQQREPVVKHLDWVEREGVTGTFDASTSIGHYIATITDDDRGMWFIVGQTMANYMPPDINAVRAAAQADYEQRIMAAIEITSSDVEAHRDYSEASRRDSSEPESSTSETHDGGSPGPSPLAVKPGSSDPASGRSQPSPNVSVEELHQQIFRRIHDVIEEDVSPIFMATKVFRATEEAARALLASYKIERLDRLASGRR